MWISLRGPALEPAHVSENQQPHNEADAAARGIFVDVGQGIRIVFSDLAKRFDRRVVFRSISGEASPGGILTITGPNGSGKSTLVAILCGLLRPTKGTIRYRFEDGAEIDRPDWRHQLGVVAPSMAVYEELDAMENLSFFAKVRGIGAAGDRCRSCLERVGLDPDRRTVARAFSTGMLQRLKIAQAMLHEPAVLLLDEPGSNLDPSGRDWLEEWVHDTVESGRTLVLATNDEREMEWGTGNVALAG
jgi:ABC-type multidrug transport system ATPase subunit